MSELSLTKLLEEARKPYDHGQKHAALYASALDDLNEIGITHAYLCQDDLTVSVTGDKHKLEAVWSALRKHGFKAPSTRPGPTDPSFSGWFRHENEACVYLSFASTVCRRVKIGTKTIEQDVYETVCGELELPT